MKPVICQRTHVNTGSASEHKREYLFMLFNPLTAQMNPQNANTDADGIVMVPCC